MCWKKMNYWMKGGIILALIYILLLIISIFIPVNCKPVPEGYTSCTKILSDIINLPSTIMLNFNFLTYFLTSLIFYFTVGAVIGFIIEKIKSEKKAK